LEEGEKKRETKRGIPMRAKEFISMLAFCLLLSGCSNTRFLAEDEILYTGREKVEFVNKKDVKYPSSVKNYVESITSYKVNNALFGRRVLPPVGLWVNNYFTVNEEKKFRTWLLNAFSSEPVIISDLNPELRAQKIENDMFDIGYFNTRAWSTVNINPRNPKKARVSYFVELSQPSYYKDISFDTLSESIDTLINKDYFTKRVKPGDQFSVSRLESTREGLSRQIQDSGFYYFKPEYISIKADTSAEKNMINLRVGRLKELPLQVISVYTINDIKINISQGNDTAASIPDTTIFDDITLISGGDIIKPDIILQSIYFRKDDTYSYSAYQKTINRLNTLGVFSTVKITYNTPIPDTLNKILDVTVDLVMADNVSAEMEANLVTKSTGFSGPALSVGVAHSNSFNGAEKLHVALEGGFEWQWGSKSESQLGTYSYEIGITSGLTLPKIIIPGKLVNPQSMILQQTSVNLDLKLLNRTAYYRMFSTMTELNYRFGEKRGIRHSISPLYLNSVSLIETTAEFDSILDENVYIRKSFEEQFILGAKYDFLYDNTYTRKPNNFLFQAGISTSGNLIDLIASIGKDESDRPYKLINTIYSQYIKLTTEFRYYRNGYNKSLVFRFYSGLGIPYGNSTALPYVEQFFSGGAYSIRGFQSRSLGPGSYHEVNNSYIDQSGDLRLEANLEYRFDISKSLKGALFLETGNIWLVNEDVQRPGSGFRLNTFYNQLAVGTGFGLRVDFNFFVLRADIGLPLRTAYETDGTQWLISAGDVFGSGLFHFAIGYPF